MPDRLTEINRQDLPLLRNLYTPNGSRNDRTYTVIDNYIRCFQTDPDVKHIKFICLNGDFSQGTFFIIDRNCAYTDSLNVATGELRRLLLLIDFTKGYLFMSLSDGPASIVREIIKLKSVEIFSDDPFPVYHLSKEDAQKLTLEIPDDIVLKTITEISDLEKAYSVWPFRTRASFPFLQRAAKYNPNVGVFLKDGTLVSWAFRFMTGLIMALQTDEQFYGRGYGSLIVKAQSKKIAELGHDIYAGISENNVASRALFMKIGFKLFDHVNWICTKHNWSDADE